MCIRDSRHAYYVFNKPKGVVSTMSDDEGRACIADFLGRYAKLRLYHVGRLDTPTEGMMILTNDGDLAQRMMHPSYELTKTYVAEVTGFVDKKLADRLKKGITLEDGRIKADRVKVGATSGGKSMVTIVLHSGRNRIVRRMFEAVGHPVRALTRTQIGPVRMGQLRPGDLRELTADELGALLDAVKL